MQAPAWLARLMSWRWMPSVALVMGSLTFVGFAVLIVPDDFGSVALGTERLSRATRSKAMTNAPPGSESSVEGATPPSGDDQDTAAMPTHLAGPRAHTKSVVQSIFHPTPPVELPVEPVDPNPQPPPPPPPTVTIYTQENQPPVPPPFVPGPGDPSLAQPAAPPP